MTSNQPALCMALKTIQKDFRCMKPTFAKGELERRRSVRHRPDAQFQVWKAKATIECTTYSHTLDKEEMEYNSWDRDTVSSHLAELGHLQLYSDGYEFHHHNSYPTTRGGATSCTTTADWRWNCGYTLLVPCFLSLCSYFRILLRTWRCAYQLGLYFMSIAFRYLSTEGIWLLFSHVTRPQCFI